MLSLVQQSLAAVSWEDLDPAMVQETQRESCCYTLDVLNDGLRLLDAVKTTPGRHEYIVSDAVAPNISCHVPNPDVDSEWATPVTKFNAL